MIGVRIRVRPGPATRAALGVRARLPRDPAVEKSALVIDRAAIHPITGLAKVTAASLQAALPGMDIAATPDGFTVSRGGARVLAITTANGAPTRVAALHPSIRTKLGVGVDETFAEANRRGSASGADLAFQLMPICASDATRLAATCALSKLPRLELAVAAAIRMPRRFMFGSMLDDAWVTSIVWTAPRSPARWPTIDNDGVGGLTPAVARSRDPIDARAAFRGFDLIQHQTDGLVAFDGFVGKARVFTYAQGQLTVLDPRIKLAGAGVGSTLLDARAAGLGPFDCVAAEPLIKGSRDWCSTNLPRVRLELAGTGPVSGTNLGKRRIAAVVWSVGP